MKCISTNMKPNIVLKEGGRSARFLNQSRKTYEVGKVDGCLITDPVPKCDGFVRDSKNIFLVELKGKDVPHAVKQIVNTAKLLKGELEEREIVPVIVATKCPAAPLKPKALSGLKELSRMTAGKFESGNFILRTRVAAIDLDKP